MRLLKALVLFLPLVLMACAYRPDIKQGNFLTADTIAQVKPGMTETQVRFVLGPAMVQDPFHPNRWDYVYYDNPDEGPIVEKHVVVMFKDGKVVSIEQKPVTPQGPQGHD
jgi:outer membrane protein assembly factor BamE